MSSLVGTCQVKSTLSSKSSQVKASQNINIEADNVTNKSSIISAGNNLNVKAVNFSNTRTQFAVSVPTIYQSHWKKCRRFRGCDEDRYNTTYWRDEILSSNTASVLSAGNQFKIEAIKDISIDQPLKDSSLTGRAITYGQAEAPSPEADSINIPDNNNGLFKKAPPDSTYLYGGLFDDPNSLTASRYYKERFGFDPAQNQIKFLGDPFYDWNVINQQIFSINKQQQNWQQWNQENGLANNASWEESINQLIDNAYKQQISLNLVPGVKLTKEQVNNLNADIIWYEEQNIKLADNSFTKVFAPKIYLSNQSLRTIDLGNYSGIIAKDVIISAGNDLLIANTAIKSKIKTNLSANNLVDISNQFAFKANNQADSNSKMKLATLSIKDDANNARNNAIFNAGTDLQINSLGSININNNYLQTGGSIFINASNDLNNSNFTIKSDNNVVINANNVNNKRTINGSDTRIEANNMVSINATKDASGNGGNITNQGATIKAGNLVYLTVANNITNQALIDYQIDGRSATKEEALSSNANNIRSELIAQGTIESANNLVMIAGNDVNNLGSKIKASGSALIEANNDINISSEALRDRTVTSWGKKKKGGSSITDNITNIGSEIAIGGDLTVNSAYNLNIKGSNITATGNGSLTSNFGDVNITNATDSKSTQNNSWKKGSLSSRYDSIYDYKETAVESKLNFGGNLAVNTELGEMNLIGSTLKTNGNLNIGSFTIAQNADSSYQTNPDGTFKTIDGGSALGVNIKAAELRSEHSEIHEKSKLTLGDTLKTLANPIEIAKLNLEVAKFMANPSLKKDVLEFNNGPKYEKASAKSSNATITQHSSTLAVGGNMMLNSSGDVNIAASNLDVAGNALINVNGNINIASATEKNISNSKKEEIEIGTFKLSKDFGHASASAGVEGAGTSSENSNITTTQKLSNINIGGSMLANVTNNTATANSGNLTLIASNLNVNNDAIIKTAGNFNLTNAAETSSQSNKESNLIVETGAKVGNAYVDAAYAWKAVVDAQKQAIKAAEKLKKMENLQDQGKATAKAVELAAAQLVLAQTAVATATLAASAATAGAASAASTSFGTGMYGAGYLNTTSSGIKNTTDTSISKASNFVGNGDIDITSNNNVNVLGSMLASTNGNVSLAAAKDIKIEAGTNNLNQTSKQETIYSGGSVGNNGVQLNIGMSQGESDYNKTSYTNSQIAAEKGTLTINTGNSTCLGGSGCTSNTSAEQGGSLNISGANFLAKNVALNIGNNLNVSSKQTEEDYSSSGFGFNFGVGMGAGGNGGNIGGGFNISSADMHRIWVDDITTIKGTDSLAINTGIKAGSTGDLNLTGAAILSDNLALAINGAINKKDLNDSYYSESIGFGLSRSIHVGSGSQATVTGTGGKPNSFPGGSTTISGSYAQNESSRTVYAVIGGLDSTLTSQTKDVTNGEFAGSLTIDHRLLSQEGRNQIGKELTNQFSNLGKTADLVAKAATQSAMIIGKAYQELIPQNAPEQQKQDFVNSMTRAMINNDQKELEPYIKKYQLSETEKNKVREFLIGDVSNKELITSLDQETKDKLIKVVGVFFDGTGNNREVDEPLGRATNVAKLEKLYMSPDKLYVTGIGTSGGLDYLCQGLGCGVGKKEAEAGEFLEKIYQKNPDQILIVDLVGFSRGGATASNFGNKINNGGVKGVPTDLLSLRSELLFDRVSSFGIPGNNIDIGIDLTIPKGVTAIQATAANENRIAFPVQSVQYSNGSTNSNSIEKIFYGNHSDIGGYYAPGDQGKQNDIAKETLNWMIGQANSKVGSVNDPIFKQPANQPSNSYVQIKNDYQNAVIKVSDNLTNINQISAVDYYNNIQNLNQKADQLQNNYIHDESSILKPWNWTTDDRKIYYPNDQLNNTKR